MNEGNSFELQSSLNLLNLLGFPLSGFRVSRKQKVSFVEEITLK